MDGRLDTSDIHPVVRRALVLILLNPEPTFFWENRNRLIAFRALGVELARHKSREDLTQLCAILECRNRRKQVNACLGRISLGEKGLQCDFARVLDGGVVPTLDVVVDGAQVAWLGEDSNGSRKLEGIDTQSGTKVR